VPIRDPWQILDSVPRLTRVRALLDFAWFMAPRFLPRATYRLPLPVSSVGSWAPVTRSLPAPALSSLRRYGKERGATLNDVFLAATYRALAGSGWDGASALRMTITVDLRRWCLSPEHGASVANLSAWEYPSLMRELGRSFDETLARVSAMMRRRKRSRPGLALALIALPLTKRASRRAARPAAPPKPESGGTPNPRALLIFSNEGLLDASHLRFADETPVRARIVPPFMPLPTLQLCLSCYGDALTLAAVTSENGEAPVARFLDAVLEQLPIADGAG
jgi:NRPS condensation-like uncharacterized protein